MTKQKAIEKMKLGFRVTHKFFLPEEWIALNEKGAIINQDGIVAPFDIFWHVRKQQSFETDWSVHPTNSIKEQIDYLENNY